MPGADSDATHIRAPQDGYVTSFTQVKVTEDGTASASGRYYVNLSIIEH